MYARISDDRKDGAGVDRQLERAQDRAGRLGLSVAPERVYIDNDVSASRYSRQPRPAYASLLAAAQAGQLAGVIVFKLDRLYRRPAELEALIPTGIRIECTDDTPLDLSTPTGTLVARMLAAVGDNEVSAMSVRIRAQQEQRRNAGEPHGGIAPYGWRTRREADPAEMAVVRRVMEWVVDGQSCRSIALRLNADGVRPRGCQKRETSGLWAASTLDKLVRSGRHAGFEMHGGVVSDVEPTWRRPNAEYLVPEHLWRATVKTLDARRNGHGVEPRRRLWLTGVVKCGRCGQTMYSATKRQGSRQWRCMKRPESISCGGTLIDAARLEAVLTEALFLYVDTADLAAIARQRDDQAGMRAAAELVRIERLRDIILSDAADGLIPEAERRSRLLGLKAREEPARRALMAENRGSLSPYLGAAGVLRKAWPGLSADQRRMVIRAAFGTVAIEPTTMRGRGRFDPTRIKLAPTFPVVATPTT
jgi:DNA invertase Pin-like site-specific DNA recombinase